MEMATFVVTYDTLKGEGRQEVRAFNAQQAKRKMLSLVSQKHDQPTNIKTRKII